MDSLTRYKTYAMRLAVLSGLALATVVLITLSRLERLRQESIARVHALMLRFHMKQHGTFLKRLWRIPE